MNWNGGKAGSTSGDEKTGYMEIQVRRTAQKGQGLQLAVVTDE